MKKLIPVLLLILLACLLAGLYFRKQGKTPPPAIPETPVTTPEPQAPEPPPKVEQPRVIPPAAPPPVTVIKEKTLFDQYLEAQAHGERSTLPDYSYAGFHRCGQPVPEITEESHRFFDVTRFGAIPNDGKSDRDAVIAALSAAQQFNGPAVLYFPPGNYRLFESSDFGKPPIEIKRSNLIIKGSGVGTTQLEFSESPLLGRPLILFRSSSGKEDYWRGDQKLKGQVIKQLDPFSVEVSSAEGIKPGDRINLNAQLDPLKAEQAGYYQPHPVPKGVLERAKTRNGKLTDIFELHEIKSMNNNTLVFAEPIHLELKLYENISIYRIDRVISECGIEDLSLRGGFHGQFKHHNGSRFGEDYRMIEFNHVFNSWVRRVRITDYSAAIRTWLCGFNTFSDILLEGNAGHNSITSSSSYGNLFAYIREYTDTHHGLGVSRSGVNTVFLRCVQYGSMEAHCGYPRATLYDLNEGGFEPRGGGATFTPMHDKGLTFWNWTVTRPGHFDFWPDGKPYGYFLNPVIAGLHGEPFDIPDAETDILAQESPGEPTTPSSLFEAQLANRLGSLPDWFKANSEAFESVSRHSGITITSPADQSVHTENQAVMIKLALYKGMDPDEVERIDLYASGTSLHDDFHPVAQIAADTLETTQTPTRKGVLILKAKLTNSRGEISFSKPITVFIGNPEQMKPSGVIKSTMLTGKQKNELYRNFVKQGGGEAQTLWKSKVLSQQAQNQPVWKIEKPYFKELQAFYRHFGKNEMKDALDNRENMKAAGRFFDDDLNTAPNTLYSYQDTLIQAQFSSKRRINRLDIHWQHGVPEKPVRLEIQTSNEAEAWYSVVNDEPLWESAVGRIGGTLRMETLPGKEISTIYFPERSTRSVRLLFTSFPNEVTELKFYGP